MSSSITSTLPGIMQQAYYNSMIKSSSGGALGTSLGGVGSLGFGGLVGGQAGSVGGNPTNPLQGASALRGLNQFVGQVQQTAAMRKAGLLPTTQKQGAAGGLAGLMAALGGGGGTSGLGSAGGSDPMNMLLQMFTMLQSMMGGGGSTGSLGGSNFSAVGANNAFSGSLGGLSGGIMPTSCTQSNIQYSLRNCKLMHRQYP